MERERFDIENYGLDPLVRDLRAGFAREIPESLGLRPEEMPFPPSLVEGITTETVDLLVGLFHYPPRQVWVEITDLYESLNRAILKWRAGEWEPREMEGYDAGWFTSEIRRSLKALRSGIGPPYFCSVVPHGWRHS